MLKIYKGQVNQLRQGLINQIKLTFINPEGEDTAIEFQHEFFLWQMIEDTYGDESIKVLYHIKGLRVAAGECFLTGTTANFDEFDDLELESIYDLYDLAHMLDALTAGHYSVLHTD